ncbi:MAG: helical backbone metal receptor, partial [Candidatus Cloacimonadaceae bacterium]|nr:helical backbone metal receptor [Candidatus Cloacimonadaceae bacterium]
MAQESRSIVVLSPEVAEILVAIGAEDRIVGVTEECTYPEVLLSKPRVGKFGLLDRERIISLKPALIFASALEQEGLAGEFSRLGYRVETVYPRSLAEMISEIRRIGEIVDMAESANALADSLAMEIARIKMAADLRGAKPRVYLEIYRDPLMSVSDQSFVGELIETAGGDNIFPTLERDYARIKAEDVVSARPDIIICYSHDTLDNILNRKGWSNIPAIQTQSIYFESDIDPDLIQRAGPRAIQGMQILAEIFA